MRSFKAADLVDFIVVGSGAAGGVMARELSWSGLTVVVLEQARVSGLAGAKQGAAHDDHSGAGLSRRGPHRAKRNEIRRRTGGRGEFHDAHFE